MSHHTVRNKKGNFVKNVVAKRSQNLKRGSVGPNEKSDSPSTTNIVETFLISRRLEVFRTHAS